MKRGRGFPLVVALGLAFHLTLTLHGAFTHTTTYDEASHLPAGYTYLTSGDYRLNPEHPPLAKLVAALPLLALSPVVHFDDPSWIAARQWQFGRRFLYRWNDARSLLRLGRSAVALLGVALVFAIALVAWRRYGTEGAILALVLGATSPEIIAHGGLVTTDVPLALFVFLSVLGFEACLWRPSWGRVALTSLAFGAALSTKFAAPVLLGIFVLQGALHSLSAADRLETASVRRRVRRLAVAAGLVTVVALAGLLVLWASYGFRASMTSDPIARETWRQSAGADSTPPPAALAAVARLGLVPEAYSEGLAFAWRNAAGRPSFLLGRTSETGFAHFFLVSFLVKTPLPLLVLIVLGAAASWRQGTLRQDAVLWLPVLVWFSLTLTRSLNIGHRHLLPIYPFLILVAARGAAIGSPRARAAVGALVLWAVAGTLLVHPHEIAFFNETVGGPRNGWKVLVDSSLDWGQDLDRLREELASRGEKTVRLSYFGSADPRWHGIRGELLPSVMSPRPAHVLRHIEAGELVAVSATNLQGVYLQGADRDLMARLRSETPVGRVGYSIFLFRPTFGWAPEEEGAPNEGEDHGP